MVIIGTVQRAAVSQAVRNPLADVEQTTIGIQLAVCVNPIPLLQLANLLQTVVVRIITGIPILAPANPAHLIAVHRQPGAKRTNIGTMPRALVCPQVAGVEVEVPRLVLLLHQDAGLIIIGTRGVVVVNPTQRAHLPRLAAVITTTGTILPAIVNIIRLRLRPVNLRHLGVVLTLIGIHILARVNQALARVLVLLLPQDAGQTTIGIRTAVCVGPNTQPAIRQVVAAEQIVIGTPTFVPAGRTPQHPRVTAHLHRADVAITIIGINIPVRVNITRPRVYLHLLGVLLITIGTIIHATVKNINPVQPQAVFNQRQVVDITTFGTPHRVYVNPIPI
ncbi:hypothetical protein A2962_02285 [Candidatus Woesebacteria bacterium RIFCSPLOWO2_01_FULL_39_61]|uniref:Uncharacterized protein n=1 Tax=Candidatus Woesebacteria bacterium RIFCSPHIGHO2_02_FULL_39_13 TaxID=1802505 RepID=A0A1F7Z502_9BACT|nr:MAG: hypothetical protein A2692_01300 [Candidatus Woesebacteria bacterium RIFCSPHIGHO2_01_FULL_39_95]OGM33988.1 MAG: hypothetical protein A3D01_03590 [Candidatus Woesebacteria bacterium RIFCSPHIGHO2_02_FULL_39_13]OGM38246.1 MAG: hypothetical protein A3E13_05700 [Candidatus Woesebacteria bacterium RIFCSPHIGHO2_12_FULL_40_20]OGM66952.1 MAG: hypothetical protein A2962_02285 [Candidatus Woesebacteria bacterium RIFCSPLOWO2_01_FULL_39_61]